MKIGIILGSVREGRVSPIIGNFVLEEALKRKDGNEYELVDIKEYDLPMLGTKEGDNINLWKEKIASFDGYVFITSEYNRVINGALKNAIDYLYEEVKYKPASFVGYGGFGALSAIQTLRIVLAELSVYGLGTMLNFSLRQDFDENRKFNPQEYHVKNLNNVLDELTNVSKVMKQLR